MQTVATELVHSAALPPAANTLAAVKPQPWAALVCMIS